MKKHPLPDLSPASTAKAKKKLNICKVNSSRRLANIIGKSIAAQWKTNEEIKWKSVEEIKGLGIKATDAEGNIYQAGSFNILPKNFTDTSHNIFVTKNDAFIGWIDLEDEIRPEAATVINWLKQKQLKTILLSGDRKEKSEALNRKNGVVHNCRIFYEEPVLTASIDTGSAGTRIIKQILKSFKKLKGIKKVEVDL